jgi:hypothetical protein
LSPEQLRERAWQNIQSARLVLDADPDHARQSTGFAVELALKARFCTRNGISNFPDSPKEAKAVGMPLKLMSHDLEALLKLSDDVLIKKNSMYNIDWDKASDWSVEDRYKPVGTFARDQVELQIHQTHKLFIEFVHWEILEKLHAIEIQQSKEWGPFNFFAYIEDREVQGWSVWFSDWTPNRQLRVDSVSAIIKAALAEDLFASIKRISLLHPHKPILRAFYAM